MKSSLCQKLDYNFIFFFNGTDNNWHPQIIASGMNSCTHSMSILKQKMLSGLLPNQCDIILNLWRDCTVPLYGVISQGPEQKSWHTQGRCPLLLLRSLPARAQSNAQEVAASFFPPLAFVIAPQHSPLTHRLSHKHTHSHSDTHMQSLTLNTHIYKHTPTCTQTHIHSHTHSHSCSHTDTLIIHTRTVLFKSTESDWYSILLLLVSDSSAMQCKLTSEQLVCITTLCHPTLVIFRESTALLCSQLLHPELLSQGAEWKC